RSARPAGASGSTRFYQSREERILGRGDDGDAAAAPAAAPRAAVAAAATRPSGLGRAPGLAGGAVAAVLPPRAGSSPPAARLDTEPIGGWDGIAIGEHVVRSGVADFDCCNDQLVVEARPQDGKPHGHVRPVAARLPRAAGSPLNSKPCPMQ